MANIQAENPLELELVDGSDAGRCLNALIDLLRRAGENPARKAKAMKLWRTKAKEAGIPHEIVEVLADTSTAARRYPQWR
jgi:hypothetical protein